MATVSLRGVRKAFGDVEAVKGIDLDIDDREFAVFVGPSGCGKSTLLRMIAGLEDITAGDCLIDGERVNEVPPDERGLAMVFQSYALYPHMTVRDNMAFSLRLAGVARAERHAVVEDAARTLQLQDLLDRRPRELSGGQRQRVAIGRAIVRQPRVFLFDEPLSNLDAALRVQMRIELASLHERLSATMIYVTHDQVEAMTMADKIVVLQEGVLEQAGTPLELYHHPRNLFVAGFIGSPKMNLVDARVAATDAGGVTVRLPDGTDVAVPVHAGGVAAGDAVTLGVRPEHLAPRDDGRLAGEVIVAERLGGETFLHLSGPVRDRLVVRADGENAARVHDRISVALDGATCHLFDAAGQALPRLGRHPLADMARPTAARA